MQNDEQVMQMINVIRETAGKTLGCSSIGLDEDFFDLGASSLTIVDLQIQIEGRLGLTVPTSTLMLSPSVQGWVAAYQDAAGDAEASAVQAAQ